MITCPGWLWFLIGGGIAIGLRWAGYGDTVNTVAAIGLFIFAAWMIARQQREEWWTR